MKLALVLDQFDPAAGGLERWTIGFATHLAASGHDVHIAAFAAAPDPQLPLHIPPASHGILVRARSMAECVARIGADAVLDTGTSWAGHVFMPCTGSRRLSQTRLVATHPPLLRLRAAISPKSRWRDRQMARLEREQVRRARQIIAVSALVRQLLLAQHPIAPERITVIHNGVDVARFSPERTAPFRAGLRATLGVGEGTLFLGSAHNMRLKGMDSAIRALARLVGGGAEAHLAIAGADPGPDWTRLAASLGVAARVHFLGLVDDMVPLFGAADALVHPTRWDACSLSTIEAGAAGLPVITTAQNGAAELLRDGETGYVLPDPEDVAALADRMRRLLDPSLRRRLGEAARTAAKAHDVSLNYERVEAVLKSTAHALSPSPAG
ncbi:MAG TPA: glycosyltransferase family 4 protein [Acetobacteraceae bacterium]|nr:glycosyltransferase family 4 protein [Acetobacteraceae bacterium]